jgi:tetratricopeptide (TPR) repeat protein
LAWRVGRFDEGRAAYQQAAGVAEDGAEPVLGAKSFNGLGALETASHRHQEAVAAFDAAEAILGYCSEKNGDDWTETWLDVQLGRCVLHYWRNEHEAQATVLERARPVAEQRGQPRQKVDFYAAVSMQRGRATRYLVDDSIMADYRAAWDAVVSAGLFNEMFWVGFNLGFGLLWYGDLAGAQAQLERALDTSRRADDKTLELRCRIYLSLSHLRQHHIGVVKQMAPVAEELARALDFPEYVGMARAMLAWVEWKEGHFPGAEILAQEAQDQWAKCVVHYAWRWAGLWPLAAVRLDAGRVDDAIATAREMLGPDQQRFPAELESALQSALDAWDKGDGEHASITLGQALEIASRLGFA